MGHDFEELSSRIIAAGIDVHKALGPGFVEPIYQRAMEVAFDNRHIAYEKQKGCEVHFEGILSDFSGSTCLSRGRSLLN